MNKNFLEGFLFHILYIFSNYNQKSFRKSWECGNKLVISKKNKYIE